MKITLRRICPLLLLLILFTGLVSKQSTLTAAEPAKRSYQLEEDILYRSGDNLSDYEQERCRLDVYYPTHKKGFPTVVWFHGGGLKAGSRYLPKQLQEQGIAVVPVNYRLSPKVKVTSCLEDAAASVAWVFNNIEKYGGSKTDIYVSGHSAGGYLTSMIGLDKRWLKAFGRDADDIAGLVPFSGHTITHFTVRAERGIKGTQAIIDDMAPLFHVRKDCPPLLLITGDRDQEMYGRYEENAYMWRMMQEVKHPETDINELEGFNHGGMSKPAHILLLKFIKKHSK